VSNVARLINPDLDEGANGNIRNLEMAIVRAAIRTKIEHGYGRPNRAAAKAIAEKYHMCSATVIKFAYGDTRTPSTWTIKSMSREANFQVVLVPLDAILPTGSVQLE